MSSDSVLVYRVDSVIPHPLRRDLDVVHLDGRQCVVQAGTFVAGDSAALVPPGSTVPPTPPFAPARLRLSHLKSWVVSTRTIDGVASWGLVVPPPPDAVVGSDVGASMLVKPPSSACERLTFLRDGDVVPPPWLSDPAANHFADDLGVLTLSRDKLFPGRWIICVELLDGFPCRIGYWNGAFHVMGEDWVADSPDCLYWDAMRNSPYVLQLCRDNPGYVYHGVVCGGYGDLKYGAGPHEHWFVPHVARTPSGWDWRPSEEGEVAWAPIAYIGKCPDFFHVVRSASGLSGFNYGQCRKKGVYVVDIDDASDSWVKEVGVAALTCMNPESGRTD